MLEIIQISVTITAFVLLMMLVIEFVNVKTQGSWNKPLQKNLFLQIVVASLLGAIPGCLGVYTVVSLFTHKVVGLGALVSAMIATAGDEAFIMFGMIPKEAMIILIASLVLAIVTGLIIGLFYQNPTRSEHQFTVHKDHIPCAQKNKKTNLNLKNISFLRGLILMALILFAIHLFVGEDHHNHSFDINQEVFSGPVITKDADAHPETTFLGDEHSEHEAHTHINLPKIIFLILTLIAVYIVLISPEHFIQEHIWNHVVKKHFFKVFLWTFGTLLVIFLIRNYLTFDISEITQHNLWLILLLAVLIGVVPESGPHMVFISLFIAGAIPLSILVANSIVQDGHGSLPLFAEDKPAFFKMKIINVMVGFLVGAVGILSSV